MEKTYKTRSRVNFSVSTKGVVTVETTFEAIDMENDKVLVEATKLFDSARMIADERTKA